MAYPEDIVNQGGTVRRSYHVNFDLRGSHMFISIWTRDPTNTDQGAMLMVASANVSLWIGELIQLYSIQMA